MNPIHVIIPAAGSGSRMGAGLPKLLLELDGVPLIIRTLNAIFSIEGLGSVVVTAPCEYLETYQSLIQKNFPNVHVVVGGKTRQESVAIALNKIALDIKDPDNELVVIHDGARCLVLKETIEQAITEAKIYDAVTVAVPLIDSIKEVDASGTVIKSLDRSRLWAVQTPQVFKFSLLKKAHQQVNIKATDDASLVETFHAVHIVPGDRSNIKITTPYDLKIAKCLLES